MGTKPLNREGSIGLDTTRSLMTLEGKFQWSDGRKTTRQKLRTLQGKLPFLLYLTITFFICYNILAHVFVPHI